jgi:hypothetical protein
MLTEKTAKRLEQQDTTHWNKNRPTHESIIYACFVGLSNTCITAALASLETVKELGLAKACV